MISRRTICLAVLSLFVLATVAEAGATLRRRFRLVGTPAARLASGKANYEERANRRKLSVEGEDLRGYNGMTANIALDGTVIGSIPIRLGKFDLNLDTANGRAVPFVGPNARFVVSVGAVVVLAN